MINKEGIFYGLDKNNKEVYYSLDEDRNEATLFDAPDMKNKIDVVYVPESYADIIKKTKRHTALFEEWVDETISMYAY